MGTNWWSMPTLLANPRSRPETPFILVHLPQPLAQPRQDQEETANNTKYIILSL